MKQTENLQLPILQSGDKYTKETQNEAFKKVDLHLGGLAKRVNNIVASGGESNIEIVDARVDTITGVVHNTIGERMNSVSEQLDTKVNNKELLSSFLKMDNVIITDEYDELTETSYTKTIIPYKIDDNIIKWEVSVPEEWTSDNLILETPRNQSLKNDFSVCINGGLHRANNKPIV